MIKAIRTMLIVLLNIVLYSLVIFGGIGLCRIGYQFAYATVGDTSRDLPPGRDVEFVIGEQETEYNVAVRLAKSDVIQDRYSFYLRMQLEKSEGESLRSGTFALNSSMTYEEIRNVIYQKKAA